MVENMMINKYFRVVFWLFETFANGFYNFQIDLPQIHVHIGLFFSFWSSPKANFVENMTKDKYFKEVLWLFLTFAKWILRFPVRFATNSCTYWDSFEFLKLFKS